MKRLSLKTSVWLWIVATIITLAAAIYQRGTGPTYPVRGRVTVGSSSIKYKLLRSADATADAMITIPVLDRTVTGELTYKRYKSNDEWTTSPMQRVGDDLVGALPEQPPAGKMMYSVNLMDGEGRKTALTAAPVVLRFKGAVPFYILHPHIFFMFFSMLVGTRCGLEAMFHGDRARRMAIETAAMLFVGGMILGPIVQKYAFGAFWTGWPFGHDLTDNKTAFAMLFWVIALWRDRTGKGRPWYMLAAVMQLVVYSIPHSVLGSEIDYTKKV
ncbi:MAG TPA: hypothetical protein VGL38_07220 [bacterium]|jgi:hypothetical protein